MLPNESKTGVVSQPHAFFCEIVAVRSGESSVGTFCLAVGSLLRGSQSSEPGLGKMAQRT
ncbi:hypothetical protein RSSM_06483 [Rhodopirellula sallentina SM41]|uniref:Uncharacterized protein n=1 Tax=Rhodopirellula sallentina SM41 TaxID=1263870 RepID=M5TSC0_9BACT|nr:hypothetical protein RSSM_06483 [Rhodopirellula sallentina SM41]